MKRTRLFAASRLNVLQILCRRIFTALAFVIMLNILAGPAHSQSKDRDNPTRLTSNEIVGLIDPDKNGDNYHYTFVAGPGEVKVTLTVESGSGPGKGINEVKFDLFDDDAKKIADKFVIASGGGSEQGVIRVSVTRRQSVLLRVTLQSNRGPGKYRIRLSGAVDVGQGELYDPTPELFKSQRDKIDNPECLPKRGTLIVKMKDGSVTRIDLSQAKEIMIEP
jgi:hypothetical protein